ncbi:MAG: integrase [Candidatus Bathyarchaeia archaeon]|nr:integrase [Candidatus Bathyarchaeia archaeon]
MGLPGFEPGSFPHSHKAALREPKSPKNPKLNSCLEIGWNDFEVWCQSGHTKAYARKLRNYAKAYSYVLFEGKASVLSGFSKGKRRNAMAALANLAKYLGVYKRWKTMVEEADLKWQRRSQIEVFLSIMNTDLSDVQDWLREAVQKLPEKCSSVLIFNAATGLRPGEACTSAGLLSQLAEAERLDDYLNMDLKMLEHFKYPELFLRRSKNAYISFVPDDVLQLIKRVKPKITPNALKKALSKKRLPNKIMGLRKLHGTTLRNNGIQSEVVDLLHGRIQQSIFLRHYYRPDILAGIREKALKAIQPLINETLAA